MEKNIVSERNIDSLFNQIKIVEDTYKIVKRNTGEDFNLFSILGMERLEVKTHSKFLAELLNPKGAHDQGGKFLNLFTKYLNGLCNNNNNEPFLTSEIQLSEEQTSLRVEMDIGKSTVEEGGRIDICLTDDKNIVVIENKIDAREGVNQIKRYQNYVKLSGKKGHIFFLTLFGTESQTVDNSEKIYLLSYFKHIIEWLEICKKEAVDLPILRESIGQYINLIKKLTHQTTNRKMEIDIQKIILKNISEAALVANNYNHTLIGFAHNIIEAVHSRVQDYLDLKELTEKWMICKYEKVSTAKNRGMIWLRPREYNEEWVIGIEDFNPLFNDSNFNHRIFMGIRSEKLLMGYRKKYYFDSSQSWGAWNNYKFISDYNNHEVRVNNEKLLAELTTSAQQELFVEHITNNFIEYFESHRHQLLKFLQEQTEI